jgi:hypothetical protein
MKGRWVNKESTNAWISGFEIYKRILSYYGLITIKLEKEITILLTKENSVTIMISVL